ncbi:MAG TPA: hypothetical protein VHR55_10720 [Candidatus Limnocylindria bacterium]|nr:hypothetical protein [Candidatus Limnocylindria bacterium]
MRSTARLLAASLALLATFVPIRQVAACDCAVSPLPQAIAEAEVAIIGRLAGMGASEAEPGMRAVEPVRYTWAVERSRDPINGDVVEIVAWPDDGANCGMTFGDGRWLVLAHEAEGRLETDGCMQNLLLDGAPPATLATVEELVATPVGPGSTSGEPMSVPVPILVGLGALLLVGLVSLLAFRRGDTVA